MRDRSNALVQVRDVEPRQAQSIDAYFIMRALDCAKTFQVYKQKDLRWLLTPEQWRKNRDLRIQALMAERAPPRVSTWEANGVHGVAAPQDTT